MKNTDSVFLISGDSFSNVKAGVEAYSEYLKNTFPSIQPLFAGSCNPGILGKFPPLKEPARSLSVQKQFLAKKQSLKPSLLITQGMYGWAIGMGKAGCPVINICHGSFAAFAESAIPRNSLEYLRTRYIYSYFEKKSASNADALVANSKFTHDNIKKYYSLESKIIYNPVDTAVFRPLDRDSCREKLGLPKGGRIALFVGRPSFAKGFDIFEKVAQANPEVDFISVTFPKAESPVKNISCFDPVAREKLLLFYNSADVVLFPSRFDGFGFVPVEALACNVPVVCSETGIIKEIDTKGIFKARLTDAEEYSRLLGRALKERGLNSHAFIEKRFSLEKFSDSFTKLASAL